MSGCATATGTALTGRSAALADPMVAASAAATSSDLQFIWSPPKARKRNVVVPSSNLYELGDARKREDSAYNGALCARFDDFAVSADLLSTPGFTQSSCE